jgi:hypothetical protein
VTRHSRDQHPTGNNSVVVAVGQGNNEDQEYEKVGGEKRQWGGQQGTPQKDSFYFIY